METVKAAHFAVAHRLESDELDGYATGGVALSRDAAHRVVAALNRDAYEMRERGGVFNEAAADDNEALAKNIGSALVGPYPRLGAKEQVNG